MRKILFVSSTPLSLEALDGKQKRALNILQSLSKKNKIDIVCLEENSQKIKKKINFCNQEIRFKLSFFSRLINAFISFLKFQPLQNGYFFSKDIAKFVQDNKDNYDTIIFHLIRCCQYHPSEFRGKTILEMTDLVSESYRQIIIKLSIINPLKYIYILERFLIKMYERKVSNRFDNIVFISSKELFEAKKFIDKNKIIVVENSFNIQKNIFKFKKNNNKILFLGDINYLPNKIACKEFAKKVLPKLNKKYPDLVFHIFGKISLLQKFVMNSYKNVEVHGPVSSLKSVFRNSVCGICNVKIATGFQNKIPTYMSYGIPAVVSKDSFSKKFFKNNKDIIVFSNNDNLIKMIFRLVEEKKLANKISRNSLSTIKKKLNISKIYLKYQKIVK